MKSYSIEMEISGNTAMWTRPDTGDCPVSYPAPTYSAVKGIFESILWGPAIEIIPQRVEICSPIVFHHYHTNYGGPLRKKRVIESGSSFQLFATVLIDVCYKLYAKVMPISELEKNKLDPKAMSWYSKTTSPGHAYRDIFTRRLKRGQCFYTPFLGWKEFGSSYFGPVRDNTLALSELNLQIPSMLKEVFSDKNSSLPSFKYYQNLDIRNGVLDYKQG